MLCHYNSCRQPATVVANPQQLSPTRDSCRQPATVVANPRQLSPTRNSCRQPATVVANPRAKCGPFQKNNGPFQKNNGPSQIPGSKKKVIKIWEDWQESTSWWPSAKKVPNFPIFWPTYHKMLATHELQNLCFNYTSHKNNWSRT